MSWTCEAVRFQGSTQGLQVIQSALTSSAEALKTHAVVLYSNAGRGLIDVIGTPVGCRVSAEERRTPGETGFRRMRVAERVVVRPVHKTATH